MTNPIVTVNVSQTVAPTPNTLQKTGALISQGATNIAAGNYSLLTQLTDLTPLLASPLGLSTLAWSGGTVTATASADIPLDVGNQFITTITGVLPAGYNGTYLVTVASANTFTYAVGTNPGTYTSGGTYTPSNQGELVAMATTFFAQGGQQSIYVLELGSGDANAGIAALGEFITNNSAPQFFYVYLVPRNWDGNANYLALIADYEAPDAKTYFFTTTTLATWQNYTALMKDVVALIESPPIGAWPANVLTNASWTSGVVTATTTTAHGVAVGQYFSISGVDPTGYNGTFLALAGTTGSTLTYAVASSPGGYVSGGTLVKSSYANAGIPLTEFSLAAALYVVLNYAPSSTNKVPPFDYSFLYGVTPFPTRGNGALLTTLQNANINIVGTGAEGGISDTIVIGGNTLDGNPFNYWYSVDWVQINLDLSVANAVINGSNNSINPLYYNQDGINRLQAVCGSTMSNAITYGLALGTVTLTQLDPAPFNAAINAGTYAGQAVVNAVPFGDYTTENPSDYKIGRYAGLAVVYIPARGFVSIVINVNVTNFINQ